MNHQDPHDVQVAMMNRKIDCPDIHLTENIPTHIVIVTDMVQTNSVLTHQVPPAIENENTMIATLKIDIEVIAIIIVQVDIPQVEKVDIGKILRLIQVFPQYLKTTSQRPPKYLQFVEGTLVPCHRDIQNTLLPAQNIRIAGIIIQKTPIAGVHGVNEITSIADLSHHDINEALLEIGTVNMIERLHCERMALFLTSQVMEIPVVEVFVTKTILKIPHVKQNANAINNGGNSNLISSQNNVRYNDIYSSIKMLPF
jgi:hypothetical protein